MVTTVIYLYSYQGDDCNKLVIAWASLMGAYAIHTVAMKSTQASGPQALRYYCANDLCVATRAHEATNTESTIH